MRREIRIPTLLGILALLVGVGVGVFLVGSKQLLFLKASPGEEPVYVTMTNITDTTFTVSWVTNTPSGGSVITGKDENSLSERTADDRDSESGKLTRYMTHHVTVGKFRPLIPGTEYAFAIQSGGTIYDDSGKVYRVKTGPALGGQTPTADSASGKVVRTDGTAGEGSIVYLVIPGAFPQSTLVTSSGNWIIPLGLSRTSDLRAYATYDRQAAVAEVFVQGASRDEVANASAVLANARPTPQIVLGQRYDWRTPLTQTVGTSPTPIVESSPGPSAEPRAGFSLETLATPSASTREVTILYPKNDESVNTQRPEIIGAGPRGTNLSIVVESSNKMSGGVTVENDGTWQWAVPADLAPGKHTVTVTYTDPLGQLKKIVKGFTVLAAESSLPAFESTPSASVSPSPTLRPTPTARVTIPSTESGVPNSGETTPTVFLFILGLAIISSGVVLLLPSKETSFPGRN